VQQPTPRSRQRPMPHRQWCQGSTWGLVWQEAAREGGGTAAAAAAADEVSKEVHLGCLSCSANATNPATPNATPTTVPGFD
jgi:hypothetical protein